MSEVRSLALIFFLVGTATATAANNQYCRAFFDQMADDTLYVASCSGRDNCIEKVVTDLSGNSMLLKNDGTVQQLLKGLKYDFVYKTLPSGLPNSVVVIQVKQIDAPVKTSLAASPVGMRRYGIDFACFRGKRGDAVLPQWPPEVVRGRDLRLMPFEKFDEFHRQGSTSADEDDFMRSNLHFRYFNGQACVSTLDPIRRAQFLMNDPKDFAGKIQSFFISLGMSPVKPNEDSVAQVKKYDRLKILVSNYRRGMSPQGCVQFSSKAGRPESTRLDVVLRDIEQQVQTFPIDTSQSWSFELK